MREQEDSLGKWIAGGILVIVGIVGLLANFDIIDRDAIKHLWKLWPIVPLAIGARILMRDKAGRRRDRDYRNERDDAGNPRP